jgi:glycosyltransferase involved in cell wall biosynthesis
MARQPNVYFIAVSNILRQTAIDFGVPKDRLVVCYTGIDVRKFQPGWKPISERPRRVVFVGRLVERKVLFIEFRLRISWRLLMRS